jgi:hypothetical protein
VLLDVAEVYRVFALHLWFLKIISLCCNICKNWRDRRDRVLHEDTPIDNGPTACMGFESAWTLAAIARRLLACLLDEAQGNTEKRIALAARYVWHITTGNCSGVMTCDVYEV